MKKTLLSLIYLSVSILTLSAQSIDTDPLIKTMKEELKYNMDQLSSKPHPSYFMALRLTDEYYASVSSNMGVATSDETHSRYITPQVRIGNTDLDNYKYVTQNTPAPNNRNFRSGFIPVTDNALQAVREAIWTETMQRYKIAVNNYDAAVSKMHTNSDNEDKAPCFSSAPVEQYYEKPLPQSAYTFNKEYWKKRLNEVSSIFKQNNEIETAYASITYEVKRTYVVTSEGTVVAQNRQATRIMLRATVKADDGMTCPLFKDYFAFSEKDLPDNATLIADAKDIIDRLVKLRHAPIADPYAGPAILSSSSSGVFFHEIFGHRLEAHRMKSGGQTFKKLVNEKVLPEDFQVYSDPTLSKYADTYLNGYYLYDDEGVKAERVNCVENGTLRNFLLNRIPIDGFPRSNGHGRASGGNDPVARQSNLIIETKKPYTEEQLRTMLIDEAKKQGKEYGYFFRTATSGLTYLGDAGSINSFNVDPTEVYKVFVDGRPDQLVRGVKLIGTPLSMFSNVTAAGTTPTVFTGTCGAESGQIPVTAISPSIFVSKIETQSTPKGLVLPCVLPKPEYTKEDTKSMTDKDLIFKALNDETERAMKGLNIMGNSRPYLIDNLILTGRVTQISSTLGGTVTFSDTPTRNIMASSVTLGDKMRTSMMRQSGIQFSTNLSETLDYDLIRNMLWLGDDRMYKTSMRNMATKVNMAKNRPMPEEDQGIPEIIEMPAGEHIAESSLPANNYDAHKLEDIANQLSAIFLDFPDLYDTRVDVLRANYDVYRLTSEQLKVRRPYNQSRIEISARARTEENASLVDYLSIPFYTIDEIPSTETLKKMVTEFAELLTRKAKAPAIKEFYIGPILLEDEAVNEAIVREVFYPSCIASRDFIAGSNQNSMMLGKRIIDTNLNLHLYSNMETYKGEKLLGNYTFDMDGIKPEQNNTLIEKGILKKLICGRNPAIGANEPTGNNMMSNLSITPHFGIIHATFDKCRPLSKMKSALLAEAKKAGLDHTYIVRAPKYGWRYLVRVDVKTGNEEIVRTSDIPQPSRSDMMHITATSSEELVSNRMESSSIFTTISPRAMIVENIEVNFNKPNREEEFSLKNPALRNK